MSTYSFGIPPDPERRRRLERCFNAHQPPLSRMVPAPATFTPFHAMPFSSGTLRSSPEPRKRKNQYLRRIGTLQPRFHPRKMISQNRAHTGCIEYFHPLFKNCAERPSKQAETTLACISCALRLLFVFIPFTDYLAATNFQKVIS
jgi:hypothetical protein